jgi:uncharacterized phosphosugar-binding protein
MRARCSGLFDDVIERSGDSIDRAAAVILRAVESDALVHVFGGDGHSQLAAMELVRRPGALANFSSIFGPGLGLWEKSTSLAGVSGIGQLTLAAHNVRNSDVVIVCSLHGLNAAAVDTAVASRERGCTVVALTCARHASQLRSWSRTFGSERGGRGRGSAGGAVERRDDVEWSQATGRHPSRRTLSDCADILIDTNTGDSDATIVGGSAAAAAAARASATGVGFVAGGVGVGSLATIVSCVCFFAAVRRARHARHARRRSPPSPPPRTHARAASHTQRSCFTMQLLNLRVCEMAAASMPPIPVKLWRSTLAAGGIEHNEGIVRHFGRVDAQRRAAEGGSASLAPQSKKE